MIFVITSEMYNPKLNEDINNRTNYTTDYSIKSDYYKQNILYRHILWATVIFLPCYSANMVRVRQLIDQARGSSLWGYRCLPWGKWLPNFNMKWVFILRSAGGEALSNIPTEHKKIGALNGGSDPKKAKNSLKCVILKAGWLVQVLQNCFVVSSVVN